MANVVEFYIPNTLQKRVKWIPPEQRGKVIEFYTPEQRNQPDEKCALEMRARLQESNYRTQSNLVKKGAHGEAVPHFDSKPGEALASPPTSFAHQMKKAG